MMSTRAEILSLVIFTPRTTGEAAPEWVTRVSREALS